LQKDLPQVYGLMVGDGSLKNTLEKKVEELGLKRKIIFAGYQQDVRPWISMSDILLLTSDTEGMPGVVLEASAMKILTISGKVGGVEEIIESNKNGYIVNWDTMNQSISLIFKIVIELQELQEIRFSAFERVKNNYSIDFILKKYKTFFNLFICNSLNQ
jgi:glycosyltransferase involved in cell wall biosynthesis